MVVFKAIFTVLAFLTQCYQHMRNKLADDALDVSLINFIDTLDKQ